jgi:hypothetical protein
MIPHVAGPFVAGTQPGDAGTLPGLRIAEDADRWASELARIDLEIIVRCTII